MRKKQEKLFNYNKLRTYRQKAGLSIEEAALRANMAPRTLEDWERRGNSYKKDVGAIEQLNRLVKVLNCKLDDITISGRKIY